MEKEQKHLSIYIAERYHPNDKDPEDVYYHAFLMLVDEATQPPTIHEQLHFVDGEDLQLEARAMRGIHIPEEEPDRYQNLRVSPIIGGDEAYMLEMWNHALKYAFYIKAEELKFDKEGYKHDPEALNCRKMVIATLRNLGIETDPKHHFAQAAGTQNLDEIPLGQLFRHDEAQKSLKTARMLWKEAEDRSIAINRELPEEGRYLGPAPEPFLPMHDEPG